MRRLKPPGPTPGGITRNTPTFPLVLATACPTARIPGMAHEIEAKFKVADHQAVRKALRRERAEYLATVVLTDCYYDTFARALLDRDCGLRIRHVRCLRRGARALDTRPLLTVKGPGRPSARAKIRHEVQARLDDAPGAVELLEAMDLMLTFTVQKRRASYRLAGCLIELDELPLIGCFVEIEAPREGDIAEMATRLGIEGPPITDHYVALMAAACKQAGLPVNGATFE